MFLLVISETDLCRFSLLVTSQSTNLFTASNLWTRTNFEQRPNWQMLYSTAHLLKMQRKKFHCLLGAVFDVREKLVAGFSGLGFNVLSTFGALKCFAIFQLCTTDYFSHFVFRFGHRFRCSFSIRSAYFRIFFGLLHSGPSPIRPNLNVKAASNFCDTRCVKCFEVIAPFRKTLRRMIVFGSWFSCSSLLLGYLIMKYGLFPSRHAKSELRIIR